VVESGDKRGRELGFPTANITVAPDRLLPTDGVYSGWYVRADGTRHATAISLGTRPHFYDQHGVLLLEAHLLDFVGDLYGEKARVQFVALVREQRAFASLDALIGQLNIDVETTRELLGL
jgi:riboflavin kinase/FMN adenylyltransferase